MHNRTNLIQFLIDKYNLQSYCELGTQVRSINFDKIRCNEKFCVDVDPKAKADFTGSTDDFFKQLSRNYDIYFIDASHYCEDVKKDFENCLKYLNVNGFVVLHDCNPEKEEHTIVPRPTKTGHWNGDVYKFAIELGEYYKKFSVIDIDNGCGVWNNSGGDIVKDWHNPPHNWASFDIMRKQLLNLISWDEFINL